MHTDIKTIKEGINRPVYQLKQGNRKMRCTPLYLLPSYPEAYPVEPDNKFNQIFRPEQCMVRERTYVSCNENK